MSAYLGSTPVNVLDVLFRNKKVVALYRGSAQVWLSEFSPLTLFADGKQGVWYDPSDKSTLFQDVAGTVPVTKDGDPVGLMKDKSGNGNHATQTASAARPIYKTDGILHWLSFDGIDDSLILAGMSMTTNSLLASVSQRIKSLNRGNDTTLFLSTDGIATGGKTLTLQYRVDEKKNRTSVASSTLFSDYSDGVMAVSVASDNMKVYSVSHIPTSSTARRPLKDFTSGGFLGALTTYGIHYISGAVFSVIITEKEGVEEKIKEVFDFQNSKAGVTL